jgi:hypothetical protein
MDHIFWPEKPMLATLHPSDPEAAALAAALEAGIPAAMMPLQAYLKTLKPYEAWLQLDPAAAAADFQVGGVVWRDVVCCVL